MLTPDEIHQLAAIGAHREIGELEDRIARLRAEFPTVAVTKARNGTATSVGAELRRRAAALALDAPIAPALKANGRPPMSATARAKISRAQKARWRKQRTGKH